MRRVALTSTLRPAQTILMTKCDSDHSHSDAFPTYFGPNLRCPFVKHRRCQRFANGWPVLLISLTPPTQRVPRPSRSFVQSHDILYKMSRDILYTPGASVSRRGGAIGMAWKTMDVQEQRVARPSGFCFSLSRSETVGARPCVFFKGAYDAADTTGLSCPHLHAVDGLPTSISVSRR